MGVRHPANGRYILDEKGEPELCPDLMKWSRWLEQDTRRFIAKDRLPGGRYVSTVFLAIDYNFFGDGPPILWESMVFDRKGEGSDQRRYRSKADALKGHAELIAKYSHLKAV